MKLHRIRLQNFRGVTESDVSFAESGVTIVEGPNEIGKSSIAEALQMAIDLPDSSKKAQVKSVQPVDRDEGPEVEIEMSTGPYTLVYKKRWLIRRETVLKVMSPRNENLIGREAHQRLEEILAETLDKDLLSAVQIDQGTDLTLPKLSKASSLRTALDRAAGGDTAPDDEDTLWESIKQEYEKYWTPKSGQPKAGRKASEDSVTEAEKEVRVLDEQIKAIEKDAAQMIRLVDEAARISATRDELEKSESDLSEQWTSIERMRRDVDSFDALHRAAESKRDQVAGEWSRRQEMIANLDARTKELTALESEAEEDAPTLAAAIRRSEEAAATLRKCIAALRDAEAKRDRAIQDRDFLRHQIEVAQITERYDRYVKAEQTLKEAEDYLEFSKVDDGMRDGIERAYLEDQRAKAATDSAAASFEATALADITVQVAGKDLRLAANAVIKEKVEDEVVLVIPGVVRMRVDAGPEAKGLAERRRRTRAAYRHLCDEVGVADLDEARRAAQERRDALRNRKEARQSIMQDLRDLTPDILLAKIEQLTERVASYPVERPEAPPLPADHDEAESLASRLEGLVGDRRSELSSREEAAEKAKDELSKARSDKAVLAARIRDALSSREEAASHPDIARKSQSDKALIGALALAQQEFMVSLKSLEEMKERLKAAAPGPLGVRLDTARDSKRRAIQELESNRDNQTQLGASLEIRGEKGLQGLKDQAVVLLRRVKREHEGTEARAKAARLLLETFEKHRSQAHKRYRGPFKERIDQFGRFVFGPTFEVELNEELQVVRRTLDGVTLNVADQLSTGAREQLGVLSRLACAAIVSPDDGGAPVMIDDALGWSDPQRLQSMGAVIAAAGQQCQVVILTCTPGRYSYVGNAKVVTLIP